MEFSKITAPSLKDLFVQQLEEKILSGELPVGSKIPPERELAEKMRVSRAVVNGGINELILSDPFPWLFLPWRGNCNQNLIHCQETTLESMGDFSPSRSYAPYG